MKNTSVMKLVPASIVMRVIITFLIFTEIRGQIPRKVGPFTHLGTTSTEYPPRPPLSCNMSLLYYDEKINCQFFMMKINESTLTHPDPFLLNLGFLNESDISTFHHEIGFFNESLSHALIIMEDNNNLTNYFENFTFNTLIRLDELQIINNILESLPSNVFSHLDHVVSLKLSNNQLSTLNSGSFNGLAKLKGLDISCNNLTLLPENIFNDTKNLRLLDMHENKLTTLRPYSFKNLRNLLRLDIEKNNLISLPTNAFVGLETIEILNLKENNLTRLEIGMFNGLENLLKLVLTQNQLNFIAANVFSKLEKLVYLELNGNNLSFLEPDVFNNLPTSLFYLDISDTGLKPMNNTFDHLKKLEHLIN